MSAFAPVTCSCCGSDLERAYRFEDKLLGSTCYKKHTGRAAKKSDSLDLVVEMIYKKDIKNGKHILMMNKDGKSYVFRTSWKVEGEAFEMATITNEQGEYVKADWPLGLSHKCKLLDGRLYIPTVMFI